MSLMLKLFLLNENFHILPGLLFAKIIRNVPILYLSNQLLEKFVLLICDTQKYCLSHFS